MTEAILLAGGQGARLRPVTVNTPKPMVPAAGVPFLAYQIARAAAAGVDRVVLATCYLDAVVGDGARVGADNELGAGVRVWCDAVLSDGALRFSSDRV